MFAINLLESLRGEISAFAFFQEWWDHALCFLKACRDEIIGDQWLLDQDTTLGRRVLGAGVWERRATLYVLPVGGASGHSPRVGFH